MKPNPPIVTVPLTTTPDYAEAPPEPLMSAAVHPLGHIIAHPA